MTSSLHGLGVADSLGIPAMWTLVGEPLNGGTFTFLDYEAAVTPARTRQAEDLDQALADVARARSPAPDVVADVQRRLVSALSAWQSRR